MNSRRPVQIGYPFLSQLEFLDLKFKIVRTQFSTFASVAYNLV